jgi:phage/plasmid-associated DNA primase
VLLTVEAQIRELPCCEQGASLNYCNSVVKFLQGHLAVKTWGPKGNEIPLRDGILSTTTQQIRAYKPQDLITHQLPINWADKDKGCKPILDWLQDAAGSPAVARLLLAWINAVVTRRVDLQRFLLLVGPGGSGKSTYLGLLRQMIGAEGVGATELSQLEGNRFELASLADKSLITISDQGQYRGSLDRLKGIVGQDPMRLERKGVQGSLSQPIRSMVVMAANELPGGSDTSSGIERRRLVVPFCKIVPPHERRDLDLEFRPFLAGLLAAALAIPTDEVTQLIRSTNTAIPALAQVHLETLLEVNSMAAWADECLVLCPGGSTPIGMGDPALADTHLYASYVAFCKLSGSHPVSLRRFSPALIDLLKVQLRVKNIEKEKGKKHNTIKGIQIRSTSDYSPKMISGGGLLEDGGGSVEGRWRVETLVVEEVEEVEDKTQAKNENEKIEIGIPTGETENAKNVEELEKSSTPSTTLHQSAETLAVEENAILHQSSTNPPPPSTTLHPSTQNDTAQISVESTCEDMQDLITKEQAAVLKAAYRGANISDKELIKDMLDCTGIRHGFRWGLMTVKQLEQMSDYLEARLEAQAPPGALES